VKDTKFGKRLCQIYLVIDEKLTIACKSKSLQIIEIQKEGKKRLTIGDFLAGNNISIGQMIK